jgi:hypothetical protein
VTATVGLVGNNGGDKEKKKKKKCSRVRREEGKKKKKKKKKKKGPPPPPAKKKKDKKKKKTNKILVILNGALRVQKGGKKNLGKKIKQQQVHVRPAARTQAVPFGLDGHPVDTGLAKRKRHHVFCSSKQINAPWHRHNVCALDVAHRAHVARARRVHDGPKRRAHVDVRPGLARARRVHVVAPHRVVVHRQRVRRKNILAFRHFSFKKKKKKIFFSDR